VFIEIPVLITLLVFALIIISLIRSDLKVKREIEAASIKYLALCYEGFERHEAMHYSWDYMKYHNWVSDVQYRAERASDEAAFLAKNNHKRFNPTPFERD